MKNFYTYLWLREDGTPYYIGKGFGRRGFTGKKHSVKAPHYSRILVQEYPSEKDAFFAERLLIAYYGRKDIGTGILRNRTDGGEGHASPSEEARRKNRAAHVGFVHTAEALEKNRLAHLGTAPSPETCEKIRQRAIGRKYPPRSEQARRNISAAQKGKRLGIKFSPEHCRKISEARKGWNPSPETRRKIGEAHKGNTTWLGRKHSEESRAKMRASSKLRWDKCLGR